MQERTVKRLPDIKSMTRGFQKYVGISPDSDKGLDLVMEYLGHCSYRKQVK
jgi:hypothetical protein